MHVTHSTGNSGSSRRQWKVCLLVLKLVVCSLLSPSKGNNRWVLVVLKAYIGKQTCIESPSRAKGEQLLVTTSLQQHSTSKDQCAISWGLN